MSADPGDPVLARVLEILARVAGPARTPATPGADTPLAEEGYWLDSLGQLEVVLACEEAFGVALDLEDELGGGAPSTAGRLALAIRRRTGA